MPDFPVPPTPRKQRGNGALGRHRGQFLQLSPTGRSTIPVEESTFNAAAFEYGVQGYRAPHQETIAGPRYVKTGHFGSKLITGPAAPPQYYPLQRMHSSIIGPNHNVVDIDRICLGLDVRTTVSPLYLLCYGTL